MWRAIRILILLLVLLFVAVDACVMRVRSTSWDRTLQVIVYPVNGDGSDAADRFIRALRREDLSEVEKFFAAEARQYGLALEQPFQFILTAPLVERPPLPPQNANTLTVIFWSLRMRYWAWRAPTLPGWADIKLFVMYYDSARTSRLQHSIGMRKGMYAVVNAFADENMQGSNQVVLAHELLHTLGATDQYEPRTNQPLYPTGFAEPDRKPLLPQEYAEIMGGRIPLSKDQSVIPQSLDQVIVGPATAAQIRWLR